MRWALQTGPSVPLHMAKTQEIIIWSIHVLLKDKALKELPILTEKVKHSQFC